MDKLIGEYINAIISSTLQYNNGLRKFLERKGKKSSRVFQFFKTKKYPWDEIFLFKLVQTEDIRIAPSERTFECCNLN